MTLRIPPMHAKAFAHALNEKASDCREGEHVTVEQCYNGTIHLGISNGHVVRAESWVEAR